MRWILRLLPTQAPSDDQVSIWSVSPRDARTFFRIVGAMWFAALALVVYKVRESWPRSAGESGWRNAGDFALAVLTDFGGVAFAIAVVAMMLARMATNLGDILMSLSRWITNRYVIPLIEAHKAEGRDEERAEWQAWYDRRIAERDGREFSEPPPGGTRAE